MQDNYFVYSTSGILLRKVSLYTGFTFIVAFLIMEFVEVQQKRIMSVFAKK